MDLYRAKEKEVQKAVPEAKRKMERELARNKDNNSRNFARYVKSKTKSRTTIGPLIREGGVMVTENKDMAEILNKYFKSVFTREDLTHIPEKVKERNTLLERVEITREEVRRGIKKLRENTAAGPDRMESDQCYSKTFWMRSVSHWKYCTGNHLKKE